MKRTLKDLRELKGLSQEEVAEALGMHQQAYSVYERGASVPSIRKAKEIADFFKVKLDDVDWEVK
mgnify:FL=1